MSTLTLEAPMRQVAEADVKMSTVTLEIPDSVAERLRDAPAQKADAARAAAIEAIRESLDMPTRDELINGNRPSRNYITLEELHEQSRAFCEARGIDYDALLATANPVIEDE